MKPSGFKNIILLYNLLLGKAFSLLVWYVSENTTFKVVVLKQLKKPCIYFKLLPSATKLQSLCFCRRLSVHRGGCLLPGGACSGGPAPRGVSALGGVCSGEGLLPGGCLLGGVCSQGVVSQHALRQTPPCPRERWLLLQTVRILLFILFSLFYFCESNLPTLQFP